MKARKTILSALVLVLLCIYIVQLIVAGRSPIREFDLKGGDEINQITLVSAAQGSVTLNKQDGRWTVGDQAYTTEEGTVGDIVDSILHVRTLGTASRSTGEETMQRFGLDNNSVITVTAYKDGKALRTLYVGKTAATGDQTYLRMDSKSDIYLASGSLRDTFDCSQDSLRSKEIYALSADDLTGLYVSGKKGSFTASKALGENGAVWSLEGAAADGTGTADAAGISGKIAAWASQVANLTAQSWADEATLMPADSEGRIELTAGSNRVSVVVAKIGSGDEAKYLCASSETPYLFYVSKTVAERLIKDAADFTK